MDLPSCICHSFIDNNKIYGIKVSNLKIVEDYLNISSTHVYIDNNANTPYYRENSITSINRIRKL